MSIHTKYKLQLLATLLFCLAGQSQAQMINCNVFMKGNHVEAGINWNGAFGTSAHPPYGYHADSLSALHNAVFCGGLATSDTALGFVADPGKDGWQAGSPAYYGDFILPGIPQEGWSYMADIGAGSVQLNSWNHDAATSDSLTGAVCSNQEYSDTGGTIRTKWQAVVGGVYITQISTLDTGNLFVSVDVIIENTSLGEVDNIYYMRTINPHNDELLSHNMSTINKIDYQLPNADNRTAVSARGTLHNDAYLVLGTLDSRAIAFINKSGTLPDANTIDNIYNVDPTNFYYNALDSNVANTSIGLVFSLGNLTSGHQAEFNFLYGFRRDVIDSSLVINEVPASPRSAVELSAFPNPTTGYFHIAGIAASDHIALFDLMGRKRENNMTTTNAAYTLGDEPAGTYFLVITDVKGNMKGRITIQKT